MPRKANKIAAPETIEAPSAIRGAWWTAETAAKCEAMASRLVLDTGERWDEARRQEWQVKAHAAILGLPGMDDRAKVWIDGPTGAGKDQVIAAAVLCVLHLAPQGFRCVMNAQDHDRARDVIECLKGFLRRDRDEDAGQKWRVASGLPSMWFGTGVEFTRNEIRMPDRDIVVECVATDGASASGARADLFIMNEVQSWADPHGFRVWSETVARYKKKAQGRLAVLSNLPFHAKGDWRRDSWENARTDKSWHYVPVRLADCPWITPEYIEEQRRQLPETVFKRLYLCEPTDGRGELIDPAHWSRCEVAGLAAATGPMAPGVRVAGVDLGVKNDHATLVVLRHDPAGAVVLESVETWLPPDKGEVNLSLVEARLEEVGSKWGAELWLDPWQAIHMRQRLESKGVRCQQVDPTEANLTEMAAAVRQMFIDGRVRVFPNAGRVELHDGRWTDLRQQLLDAELKEKARGVKIVSKRTKAGHGDQASAFALASLGISRAGVFAVPATVGSPPGTPESSPRRPFQFMHGGRFIGSRSSGARIAR